ncbi:lipase [Faecalibacterium sp. An58]|uniref:GDSL-type esterase/lipase family protein n=1 Tax=Faecalibacterium sp. An58 TaxID=1965648 RepID=UPI000B38049A|nr:GDSL-type esterase/lipase family protein [Faecalibacterium sp. An58]OUN73538.1 lipase [Faecalibacterium sp. An58]
MGISHDYNYARRRARQQGAHTKLKVLLCVAAILLLSLAITAILQTAQQEAAPPQEEILSTGTVEGILAPLPMQPGEGGAGTAQVLQFGPARQSAGSYTVLAYDSSVIRQPATGQVDLSYFADAAFLGDSLTVGFTDYSINLGGALVCGYTGAGPDTIVNRMTVNHMTRGDEVALDVLAAAQPKKLYILLGTNTLTTAGAEDRFLTYYGAMLDALRETLGPDCVIYVQSIPPVRPEAVAQRPGLSSDNLRAVNEQLAQLAHSKGCVYLDLWEALADGEGNLKAVCAAPDGVHLSAGNGYGAWVNYLRSHTRYAADSPWTPGSAYASAG